MTLTRTGNWEYVIASLTRTIPQEVMSSAVWGQRKAAEQLVKIVKNHIMRQDLPWTPKKNPSSSGSWRLYIDTGQYLSSVETWQKNGIRFVGIKPHKHHKDGVPVSDIAVWMEYGTKHMPARPLWGPSLEDLGGEKGVKRIIEGVIRNKLLRLGYL